MPTVWTRYRSLKEADAKSSVWKAPETSEHFLNTSSPEDLFMNPETINVVPGEVQDGMNKWTKESNPADANWYVFSAETSEFYVSELP